MWPPDLTKLPPLFSNLFRELVERINATTPIDGLGTRVSDGPSGRSINAQASGGGGIAFDVWINGTLSTVNVRTF